MKAGPQTGDTVAVQLALPQEESLSGEFDNLDPVIAQPATNPALRLTSHSRYSREVDHPIIHLRYAKWRTYRRGRTAGTLLERWKSEHGLLCGVRSPKERCRRGRGFTL